MMKNVQQALLILQTLAVIVITGTANAEVTYFHHDALGSTVAATDESGSLLWRESYQPYGERLDKAVSTDEHSTYYTGKPHDDRTGLTYFGARHYDPVVGRFMGVDPVAVDPNNIYSFNRYAYANNNPYKYVDPDGNLPFLIPVLVFVAKEVAAEAFERTTGMPALFSVKGVVKAVGKKLGRSAGKKAANSVTKSGRPIHSRYGDNTPVYKDQRPSRLSQGPVEGASGPHTKLRMDTANNRVYQGREFDANGNPVRDIDFTSPTFPNGRLRPDHAPAPHQHPWNVNNPSVGPRSGFKRGPGEPFN